MYLVKKVKDANPREITCGIMRSLTNEKDFEELSVIQKEFQDMVNKNK